MPYIKTTSSDQNASISLYYEDWGSGKPVILIHGWPLSHEMWEFQLTELPKYGLRCIAYDRRGFGKSDKPWEGYDYNTLAADLNDLIEQLDLNGVTLIGFSMAGGEVVRYLTRYGSSRVSKIVLISSIIPYVLQTDTNPDGVPEEVFDQIIDQIKTDRPDFLATFGKQFYGVNLLNHPVSQGMLDWSTSLALRGSPKATTDCVRTFSATDFRSELAQINVPTLIIHGDADATVPIKPTSEQAASLIPSAEYIIYEGAPHGLFVTAKDDLTQDLVNFIQ